MPLPTADDLFGPDTSKKALPTADQLFGPATKKTAPAPAAKPKVSPDDQMQAQYDRAGLGGFNRGMRAATDPIGRDVKEDLARAQGVASGKIKEGPLDRFKHPLAAGGVARLPKEAWDAFQAAPPVAAFGALVNEAGEPLEKATRPPAGKVYGPNPKGLNLGQAMMALGPEAGERVGVRGEPSVAKPLPEPEAPPVKGKSVPAAKAKPTADELFGPETPAKPQLRKKRGAEPTPVVEPVKKTQARLQGGLDQLTMQNKADKVEAIQVRRSAPSTRLKDKALPEQAYDSVEGKMVDPAAEHTPEVQAEVEHGAPYKAELVEDTKWLKARGYKPEGDEDEVSLPIESDAHVPRRVVGKNPGFDQFAQQSTEDQYGKPAGLGHNGGPVWEPPHSRPGKLSKNTPELKSRKFLVFEHPDGTREFIKNPEADWKHGMEIRGSNDTPLKIKQATTKEIEANTDVRYHKDYLANLMDAWVRVRAARRNAEFLDEHVKDLERRGLAVRTEFVRPGGIITRTGNKVPAGYGETTIKPLNGVHFHPAIKWALDDFHGVIGNENFAERLAGGINRIQTQAMFVTHPQVHPGNVWASYFTGRGWDNFTPRGVVRGLKTLTNAFGQVWNFGPEYLQAMRDGDALQAANGMTARFHELLLGKTAREMATNPKGWAKIAKDFGFDSAAKMAKAVARASHDTSWKMSDIFVLARKMELMEKGMSRAQASTQVAREIPTYRIPSTVGGTGPLSRALAQALKNPIVGMFARWHYGLIKSLGAMGRDVVAGTGAERARGLGQFTALALGYVTFKAMGDWIARKVSGNPDATMNLPGIFGLMQAAEETAEGKRTWGGLTEKLFTDAPVYNDYKALRTEDYAGKPIIQPAASPGEKVLQGA